jgi:hypothetical protein
VFNFNQRSKKRVHPDRNITRVPIKSIIYISINRLALRFLNRNSHSPISLQQDCVCFFIGIQKWIKDKGIQRHRNSRDSHKLAAQNTYDIKGNDFKLTQIAKKIKLRKQK